LVAWVLGDQASHLIELIPQAAQKLNQLLHSSRSGADNTLIKVETAAARLKQAAADSTQSTLLSHGVQRVVVDRPRFDITDRFWSGTLGLPQILDEVGVVALITFTPKACSLSAKY
jgi:hypothetical protein